MEILREMCFGWYEHGIRTDENSFPRSVANFKLIQRWFGALDGDLKASLASNQIRPMTERNGATNQNKPTSLLRGTKAEEGK